MYIVVVSIRQELKQPISPACTPWNIYYVKGTHCKPDGQATNRREMCTPDSSARQNMIRQIGIVTVQPRGKNCQDSPMENTKCALN